MLDSVKEGYDVKLKKETAQGSKQFHCYVCTCLGIGEGVMVICKVVSAGGGHGLELVIGEQAAIVASGCRQGVEKLIVRIIHLVHAEHLPEAAFVEVAVVGYKRQSLY